MSGKFSDKLNEILGKISPTFNLISSLACIPLAGFIFNVTYMRANGFFSYEIFSINFMWIFLLMGIFFVLILLIIHGFYILGAYLRITHQRTETIQIIKDQIIIPTRNQKIGIVFYNVCIIANIIIAIMAFAFLAYCHKLYNNTILIDFNFLFIFIFLIFEISIVIISYVAIDIKRWFAAFIVICCVIPYSILLSIPLFPRYFNVNHICNKILKSINLASDHAEIYLKDKNESVISGKLIFDDGKYAYVEFDHTVSNCGDVGDSCIKTIRKKVPSEDVSIFVSPEQQQDKKSAAKLQEAKQSKAK
nr:hypothetical protein [uncultured Campylobacter sp.]